MKILILDPDAGRRLHLRLALEHLQIDAHVDEAFNQTQADLRLHLNPYEMILIGPELAMGTLLTVMYFRRRLPRARLVIYDPTPLIQHLNTDHLRAAGASLIVDTPLAPSLLARLLNRCLSLVPPGVVAEPCSIAA